MKKGFIFVIVIVFVLATLTSCSSIVSEVSSQLEALDEIISTEKPTGQSSDKSDGTSKSAGTRQNPLTVGQTGTFDGMKSYVYTYKSEVTLVEVIRGDKAWTLVEEGNRFNSEPEEGKEYILAKFKVKILESKDDEKVTMNNYLFTYVSKGGVEYKDFVSVSGLKPELTDMYEGGESEGYTFAIIDKDDAPLINFQDVWFAVE